MAWPVYSERLLATPGHVGWVFLEVPAGRRAVVKQIAAVNYGQAAVYVQAAIGGSAIWGRSVPGPLDHVQQSGMWVAYEGEELGIYCAAAGVGVSLHGFMFSAAGDSWWTASSEGSASMAIAAPPIGQGE